MKVSLEAGLIQFPGTWPPCFTKLWVGMVFQDSFWRKKKIKQGSKERGWNKISFTSAVNVWSGVLSFPPVQEITSGRFKVTRIQEPILPIFSHKGIQNLLIHSKEKTPVLPHALQGAAGITIVGTGGTGGNGPLGEHGLLEHTSTHQETLQPWALRSFAQIQLHLPVKTPETPGCWQRKTEVGLLFVNCTTENRDSTNVGFQTTARSVVSTLRTSCIPQ